VAQPDGNKLICFGTEDKGDDDICIKFVEAYSPDAHNHLAGLECAPVLRGFEKITGGWFMVVMDKLPEEFEMLHAHKERLPLSVFDDITAKLGSFHDTGYVHGDICDTNIMVSKSDEKRFMIIDFDWAGKIGKMKYSACVNRIDIRRPSDVCDGKRILKDRDVAMLKDMLPLKFEEPC